MSAALEVIGLDEALLAIDGIENAPLGELAEGIGRLVQGQVRRRIEEEKTAPDGTPWKANRSGTSILFESGALSRSIDYIASPTQIVVGSGLVYARIHNEGGVIKPVNGKALKFRWRSGGHSNFAVVKQVTMPQRRFLGLSADNQDDIVKDAEDWISRLLQP